MALFGSKKKEEVKENVENKTVAVSSDSTTITIPENLDRILIQPRVTEKASFRTEGNVYTFEVAQNATKAKIKRAVQAIYKVMPTRVNIAKIPSKRTLSRGKRGVKKGGKKAYVYLKEGDKIELI